MAGSTELNWNEYTINGKKVKINPNAEVIKDGCPDPGEDFRWLAEMARKETSAIALIDSMIKEGKMELLVYFAVLGSVYFIEESAKQGVVQKCNESLS